MVEVESFVSFATGSRICIRNARIGEVLATEKEVIRNYACI
jgi:hypothetical protein